MAPERVMPETSEPTAGSAPSASSASSAPPAAARARRVDVLVIGAGPAGSLAARRLAREGWRVLVLDRQEFPRFRIGESLLPRTREILRAEGLLDRLSRVPHARKLGIDIGYGDGRRPLLRIGFDQVLGRGDREAFNVERAGFDVMLADAAREAGAEVRLGCAVREILELAHDRVRVASDAGEIEARLLLDCSGNATVVGRHLGTRHLHAKLRNVASFDHFSNVAPSEGVTPGEVDPWVSVIMAREGWFWMIPLDRKRTSVGVVLDEAVWRRIPVEPQHRLRWCIRQCPVVAARMRDARGPETNRTTADFTYRCDPTAGPGYLLVGDAGFFIDPVWSTGVSLGLSSALEAARAASISLRHPGRAAHAGRAYARWFAGRAKIFSTLIHDFYDGAFRDVMLRGHGPLAVERGFITLLAGAVFPRIPFSAAWRWWLLRAIVAAHRRFGFAERHRSHSLLVHAGIAPPRLVA